MRAWQIEGDGGIDALALVERPRPEPGPGEILVRVTANAINYRDLSTIRDPLSRGFQLPRIPNSDGAGVVEAVGPGVTTVQPGMAVTTTFFQDWEDGGCTPAAMASALGGAREGVLAEYVVLSAQGVLPKVPDLSDEEAACLPCAALTAWNAIFETAALRPGDTVLLLGTGGVSMFALQFAATAGIRAIMTSSSDRKLEEAAALGAAHGINYREVDDWPAVVRDLTGGQGVDGVVEVGGPGTLQKSLDAVRVGGAVALIGILTGGTIDPLPVMRKSVRLNGVYVGSRRMFRDMNRAIEKHAIRPRISEVVPFNEAREAYRLMASQQHMGKIVIKF
ncbi:MAG: NAD(P)-dependent alcohol dehydrogenase [Rhodospirillales bacterium]|nr:NAD(P)-dependent alcohol dehydrogenase [Rhodospirillales bacterium]